jgi:myo-inositol-1(or 4)-monophosphatase
VGRGEWERHREAPFTVRPTGSIAYKLALVAAGLADATWTVSPRHEWDVAAGTALVLAAGGEVVTPAGDPPRFNRRRPLLPGIAAANRLLLAALPLAGEPAARGEPPSPARGRGARGE